MNEEIFLGAVTRERRVQLGLTQAELARRVGCAPVTVRKMDSTVRFYVLPTTELVSLAQSRVTRSLVEAECRQYLHLDECPAE
jgi:transcriptional regulator with XRE-family HTH domain